MAQNLARTLCTEEDKVNCPFYFKNGACRYGDHCIRRHLKPTKTVTLLFPHMYQNSPKEIAISEGNPVPPHDIKEAIQKFEDFYQEVFLELATFGEIEEMHVCDNIVNHLIGNVLVKFVSEDDSENCKKNITGRTYCSRLVVPEYSPVTDFKDGRCRQFESGACKRGGNCNFMHMKVVSKDLLKACYKQMYKENPQYKERWKEEKKKINDAVHVTKEKDRSRRRESSSSRKGSHSPVQDRRGSVRDKNIDISHIKEEDVKDDRHQRTKDQNSSHAKEEKTFEDRHRRAKDVHVSRTREETDSEDRHRFKRHDRDERPRISHRSSKDDNHGRRSRRHEDERSRRREDHIRHKINKPDAQDIKKENS